MTDDLLAGRYRRIAPLGRGAMGEVWLADDLVLGRQVAIKRLRFDPGVGADQPAIDRMVREARTAARLHDRNIVTVFDLVTVDAQPHVVMEFVDGESLAERLRRDGRLPVADVHRIAAQLAAGLEVAHRAGIVHRDVKPANIMVQRDGQAKLADFGIARGLGDAALTDTGQMIGTIAYMAPEVARTGAATTASDMWSFGATLYAAVEGRPPHDDGSRPNTTQLLLRLVTEPVPRPGHAGALEPLIMALLDVDPQRRPTAADLKRRLAALPEAALLDAVLPDAALADAPTAVTGIPATEPAAESETRRRTVDDELAPSTRRRAAAAITAEPTPPSVRAATPARRLTPRRLAAVVGAVVLVGGVVVALTVGAGGGTGSNAADSSRSVSPTVRPTASTSAPVTPSSSSRVRGVIWRAGLSGFSPDGRSVVLPNGAFDAPLFVVGIPGNHLRSMRIPHDRLATSAIAITSRRALVTEFVFGNDGSYDPRHRGALALFDTSAGRLLRELSTCGQAYAVAPFSAARVVVLEDGCMQIVDVTRLDVVATVRTGTGFPVPPVSAARGLFPFVVKNGDVGVLDVRTAHARIVGHAGNAAAEAVVSADGKSLYVVTPRGRSGGGRGELTVLDASTGSIRRRVALGRDASDTTLSRDGSTLFALNLNRDAAGQPGTGSLVEVRVTGDFAATTIGLPKAARGFVPAADGLAAFVSADSGLYRVDLTDRTVTRCGPIAGLLTLSNDGTQLWASSSQGIAHYDGLSGQLLDTIETN